MEGYSSRCAASTPRNESRTAQPMSTGSNQAPRRLRNSAISGLMRSRYVSRESLPVKWCAPARKIPAL